MSKGRVIEVVAEAIDADTASVLKSLKKPDALALAADLLEGKGWVPDVFRICD